MIDHETLEGNETIYSSPEFLDVIVEFLDCQTCESKTPLLEESEVSDVTREFS
jgi:hypothetical protein